MYTVKATNGTSTVVIHNSDANSDKKLSSGKITTEINSIPSFSFNISKLNPYYNQLNDRNTIITVHNDLTGEDDFEGVLIHSKEQVTSSGTVYKSCSCEGYLTYLNDTIQPYYWYENNTVLQFINGILAQHNANVTADKRITLGSVNINGDNDNSKTTAYRSTLEEIKVNLIERLGGEIQIRKSNGHMVLDYVNRIGYSSDTTIELAKNIQTIAVDTDSTNIITRLIPLGCSISDETAERMTIKTVNDNVIYIDDETAISKYGIIMGTVTWDDITEPDNLKAKAIEYLQNNNRIKKGYSAQVLDLSLLDEPDNVKCIRAGNTYHFKHQLINVDEELRVLKVVIDIFKPYKPNISIGDKSETITSIATNTASLIEYELPKQRIDILQSAKTTATALIKEGINGYVVVNPNEILVMDTPEKETATKVWRWNSGGFGYSSTGYDGTYGTAITMDGAIVADFITAGVLKGIEISNGDGTFHVDTNGNTTANAMTITNGSINCGNGTFYVDKNGNVNANSINITGGSINVNTTAETTDVIALNHNEWTLKLSPLQWDITNSNIDKRVLCQAGTQYFYNGGDNVLALSSDNGNVTSKGTVKAKRFEYLQKDGVYVDLKTMIDGLQQQIDMLNGG